MYRASMLHRLLQPCEEARDRVLKDAGDLLTFMGDPAYYEARERARSARAKGDTADDRHWGRVAVEIARRTGHRIGEKVVDRYEQSRAADQKPFPRRELIDALVEIAQGIADLSHGRGHATTLHNLCARVRLTADLAGSRPGVDEAAAQLLSALVELASAAEENEAALARATYPPRADRAGTALQRFRTVLLQDGSA